MALCDTCRYDVHTHCDKFVIGYPEVVKCPEYIYDTNSSDTAPVIVKGVKAKVITVYSSIDPKKMVKYSKFPD